MRSALLAGHSLGDCLSSIAAAAPESKTVFPAAREHLTTAELDESSVGSARALLVGGVLPGDLVGVLVPSSDRLLSVLFGVWRAGAAASVLPVRTGFGGEAATTALLAGIVAAAGIRHLVLDDSYGAIGDRLRELAPDLVIHDPRATSPGGAHGLPSVGEDDVALVHFAEGKGVVLPHRNLIAGLRARVVSAELSPDDVFAQWTPAFHDTGLIDLCAHLLNGADVHLFHQAVFQRRPVDVLRYLAEHRATVVAAPNSSYDHLLAALGDERFDLSSWRLAFNGGEPVDAATVRGFTERFADMGVPAHAMYPVHGVAEATASITFPAVGSAPRVVAVDRVELATTGVVRVVPEGAAEAETVVSVGKAVDGLHVRIAAAAGRLGEIQVAGPSLCTGYHRDPAATGALFDGMWLRTGDLGFRLDDDLFVAGARKRLSTVPAQRFDELEGSPAQVDHR